jgi:uncharacterized protein YaaQ
MRKVLTLASVLLLFGCAELQQVASQYPGFGTMGNQEIASGLKEALNNGIEHQVTKLTATDGFFKNQAVKILLPPELQKVDKTLRSMGMASIADEGLKVLNRAAESAVKESIPIFSDAVTKMTFSDATNILMGGDNSATTYLQSSTSNALYAKFSPKVQTSLSKVGADKVWANIITKYNSIPTVTKVNPDLKDYVTRKAMDGVFTMVAVEEKKIRNDLSARTSDLLKRVFALQDKK